MRAFVCLLAAFVAAATAATSPPPALQIAGETKYRPHTLVRLRAEGADPRAGLIWRVHPTRGVERASSPRGVLEFAAPPGSYEVELLAITAAPDGSLQIDEARVTIEIEPPAPAPPSPRPNPSPMAALGAITFDHKGCTATILGPRRTDGRWDILTAAHCTASIGDKGSLTLKDARRLAVTVTVRNPAADLAWLVTEDATLADLPFAVLADSDPLPGTSVWHAGYGQDNPGVPKEGTVLGGPHTDGNLSLSLSVSHGDSGGGIFRTDTNELIAVVSRTTNIGQRALMFGCAASTARAQRPRPGPTICPWRPVSP
jgi:hypothetical protein